MINSHQESSSDEWTVSLSEATLADGHDIMVFMRRVRTQTPFLVMDDNASEDLTHQETIIQAYQTHAKGLCLLARIGDALIGVAYLMPNPLNVQNHLAEVGVVVDQSVWGYGIGGMLLEEIIDFARQVELTRLTVEVMQSNERAIRLYQRVGFQQVALLPERVRLADCEIDTIIMDYLL